MVLALPGPCDKSSFTSLINPRCPTQQPSFARISAAGDQDVRIRGSELPSQLVLPVVDILFQPGCPRAARASSSGRHCAPAGRAADPPPETRANRSCRRWEVGAGVENMTVERRAVGSRCARRGRIARHERVVHRRPDIEEVDAAAAGVRGVECNGGVAEGQITLDRDPTARAVRHVAGNRAEFQVNAATSTKAGVVRSRSHRSRQCCLKS